MLIILISKFGVPKQFLIFGESGGSSRPYQLAEWFGLCDLVADATVRISFALRTSTSGLFPDCRLRRYNYRRSLGRPVDRADALFYKLTHTCVCIFKMGCPPVRLVYPFPSICRLAFISSASLSRTSQPLVFIAPRSLAHGNLCCAASSPSPGNYMPDFGWRHVKLIGDLLVNRHSSQSIFFFLFFRESFPKHRFDVIHFA